MPTPTPFHPRTSKLCTSYFWKDWSGHYAVRSYGTCHEREYHALRQAAGLIDVSPLHKYELRGPGAGDLLARLMVRDVRRLKVGRVTYLCWCDDDGKVIDDGTVSRLGRDRYRLTANVPTLSWLERHRRGEQLTIEDASESMAALAVQGPRSRELLAGCVDGDVEGLRFFRITEATIAGRPVQLSRTGYTGDLGYELWIDRDDALAVWDAVVEAGAPYRLLPAGLDAMDVTRIEAGFVLSGVDYFNALHCLIDARKSSPFEIGLGRAVTLDRDPFIGRQALLAERARPARWSLVGLRYDWDDYEQRFADAGLPPSVPAGAWREAVPVFDLDGRQIGQATSGAWSPRLKQNLALATVESAHAAPGTRLRVEVTVEYRRQSVGAVVTRTPFFDPPRKRA
jgi:aminomethyltransferase